MTMMIRCIEFFFFSSCIFVPIQQTYALSAALEYKDYDIAPFTFPKNKNEKQQDQFDTYIYIMVLQLHIEPTRTRR